MTIFRITTHQWCRSLTASGNAARWNAKGQFVIYTASSRSLACLENIVHRSGEGNDALYKVMVIDIPDNVIIEKLQADQLKTAWYKTENYLYCQSLGHQWLSRAANLVLQVPSVIVRKEHNYLINPQHPDFKKIKLADVEDFDFDKRF